ncbi:MAG: tetratricopeptide repeat protein [Gemmatimonadaceae bacterium]
MSIRPRRLGSFAGALLCGSVALAQEHKHTSAPGQELIGRVVFPVSCDAEASAHFARATAMLHSFWFEAAEAEYGRALQADASCGMAHWGIAMTLLGNPYTRVSPNEERLRAALASAEKASELTITASRREQLYVAAVTALYREWSTVPHGARMQRHEAAMKKVADSMPNDPEAAIFYARAVVANAPPSDLKFERQLAAAAILEPIFVAQPEHPGLAHYIIHAFDAPSVAKHGLAAARRYADIAPAAPHALHMPSHIFTRLGYWHESIATNRKSANAEADSNAAVHAMDYMAYAYLQLGKDQEAWRVVERSVNQSSRFYQGLLGYNFAAMRARYALERNDWASAVQLPVPTQAPPYVTAVPRFARAVGAARSGQPNVARENIRALAVLRDTLKKLGDDYWTTIVEAQRLAAAAWLAHAERNDSAAARLAREAAALEETVEKHPITPGPLIPARELEADLLFELERYGGALWSYAKTLEREPRRARALFGAARAAERSGEIAQARRYYTQVADLMKDADSTRAEPRVANAFLARRN